MPRVRVLKFDELGDGQTIWFSTNDRGVLSAIAQEIEAPSPAELASGSIAVNGNTTPTVLTVQGQWYPVVATWFVNIPPIGLTPNAGAGELIVTREGRYHVALTIVFTQNVPAPGPSARIEFGLFKNGAVLPTKIGTSWVQTNEFPNTVAIVGLEDVLGGDVLDLRAQSLASPNIPIVLTDANFSVLKVA